MKYCAWKYRTWVSLLGMSLVLLGCASSDKSLAEQGDWFQIGYRDGIAGHQQRTYKALSVLGAVQQADYDNGYSDGVKKYCNPNVAYQIGLSGQYYDGICDGTSNANRFRMEWRRGWEQYSNE